jgi:hypothetical protein
MSPDAITNDAPRPFPIIVGVAGHHDIPPNAEKAVRHALAQLLRQIHGQEIKARTHNPAALQSSLFVLTGTARGADRLAQETAVLCGINRIQLGPSGIEPTDQETARFFAARAADAALTLDLPILCDRDDPECAKLHSEQLAAVLSRRSHILVLLWDGAADREAHSTLADLVEMRQQGETQLAGFRKSPLFNAVGARLDLVRGGPIVVVATASTSHGSRLAIPLPCVPGDCFLLRAPTSGEHTRKMKGDVWEPLDRNNPWATLGQYAGVACGHIEMIHQLNQDLHRLHGTDLYNFQQQWESLCGSEIQWSDKRCVQDIGALRAWQAGADAVAQSHQRHLVGNVFPAGGAVDAVKKAIGNVRAHGRPRLGVIFWYAAAVPAGIFCLELYGAVPSLLMLGAYLAVLVIASFHSTIHVQRKRLQNRFQDDRALAEAMRVQLYWALAASKAAVADNYLRKQLGELGWIEFALRGPALWAAHLAQYLSENAELDTATLEARWIYNQRDYFARKHKQFDSVAKSNEIASRGLIFAGIGAAALLLALETARYSPLLLHAVMAIIHLPRAAWTHWHEPIHYVLLIAAAALPAFGAFFAISKDLRHYEAHAQSYNQMHLVFQKAAEELERSCADALALRALVMELGREALAENAEWLLEHRRKPIGSQ